MTNSIQIPYSKSFAYFGLIFTFGMTAIFFPFQPKYQTGDASLLLFDASVDIVFLLMGLIFIIKFFIPSVKGVCALELNKDSIIDNVRHRKIYWNNISGVRMTSSSYSSGIAVDIVDKDKVEEPKSIWNRFQSLLAQLFFGTPVVISNKFIKGSDKEIFAQVLDYFERQKDCA
jgi:hypothetical protein